MRTSETLLLDFIRQSPQFRIPVNQRRYAWTQRHCRQLWDDILDAGERQDVREHFLGPIMGSVAKSGWLVTCLRDLERGVEA